VNAVGAPPQPSASPEPRTLALTPALAHLASGGLVAFPTETTWGLAADASSAEAVAQLRRQKGRGPAHPISVLVEDLAAAERLGAEPNRAARLLAQAFWPGPLTLVVPSCASLAGRLARGVAGAGGAVGLRCAAHPAAQGLAAGAEALGLGPLTATSLNRSTAPAARTRPQALGACADLGGVVLLAGSDAGGSSESSVVDVTGPHPKLLREGAIGAGTIAHVFERAHAR